MKRKLLIRLSFCLALIFIVACTQPTPTPTQPPPPIEETTEAPPTETLEPLPTETSTKAAAGEDVEALIMDRCSECHSADRVFRADKTESEWDATIDRMLGYGAEVNEEEKDRMIEWLVLRDE